MCGWNDDMGTWVHLSCIAGMNHCCLVATVISGVTVAEEVVSNVRTWATEVHGIAGVCVMHGACLHNYAVVLLSPTTVKQTHWGTKGVCINSHS